MQYYKYLYGVRITTAYKWNNVLYKSRYGYQYKLKYSVHVYTVVLYSYIALHNKCALHKHLIFEILLEFAQLAKSSTISQVQFSTTPAVPLLPIILPLLLGLLGILVLLSFGAGTIIWYLKKQKKKQINPTSCKLRIHCTSIVNRTIIYYCTYCIHFQISFRCTC